MNEKIEVKLTNIIGGFCTLGFLISIIAIILAIAIPKEFVFFFWLITILAVNLIIGIIIRISRHHEWARTISSPGAMWGVILALSIIAIGYFMAQEDFVKCQQMTIFNITAFIFMLKIGFSDFKNIGFDWK